MQGGDSHVEFQQIRNMPTIIASNRREVRYESLEAFLADAERVAKTRFHTVGKWTYPQILEHLATTMHSSFDGFGFKAPWIVRVILAPFIKNSFLTNPMKAGFKLPRKMAAKLLPDSEISLPQALDNVRVAVARIASNAPTAEHPAFGKLARQEWTSLHLRHAELHMSFVSPE